MKWLFIIDPLETLDPHSDTSYCLMQETCRRGIKVFHTSIERIRFHESIRAVVAEASLEGGMLASTKPVDSQLDDFDLIFIRKEPPYNLQYHYALQLLSLSQTPVVNAPQALRDFNEKLMILDFPEWIPSALVASDKKVILDFLNKHEVIVLKALTSLQGREVRKLAVTARNKDAVIDSFTQNGEQPVMVQRFIPEIAAGNKRILLLNGEILGAYNCLPPPDDYLTSIFRKGVKIEKTTITPREQDALQALAPFLRKHGLHFVGVDMIGGFLSEINITCPGNFFTANQTQRQALEIPTIDYFQQLVSSL